MLGSRIARRLPAKGVEIGGYALRREPLTALEPSGLRPAGSAREAVAGADCAFTILTTPEVVEQVWLAPGGLLDSAATTTLLCQASTIAPRLARRLGEAAAARGFRLLRTPLRRARRSVGRGEGPMFVGGDAAVLETCRPAFGAIAARTVHLGPVGAASVAKLAANLVGGINAIALAEALVLGAKAGLAPAALLEALRQSPAASGTMNTRGPLMVSHRFDPHIRLDLFLKALGRMRGEGKGLGMPLPLTSVAHQLCTAASAAGHGAEDLAAVITTLESLAGLRS